MTTVRKALAAVVAAGLLAACGTGGGEGGTGDGGGGAAGGGLGKPPIGAEKPLRTPVKAPEGFDTSKGWQETVTWLPEKPDGTPDVENGLPVGAAPRAGVVAFLQPEETAYVVEARDEATGTLRWSSRKWEPPVPVERRPLETTPRTPGLLVVEQDGREYVVVWAYGIEGEDELSKGRKIISLAVYPADSSGKAVAPAHTVSVPAETTSSFTVMDGGDGILLKRGSLQQTVSVDAATGRVKTYDADLRLPVYCEKVDCYEGTSVVALSPAGPVLRNDSGSLEGDRGFGVPGGWQAVDAAPPGIDTEGDEEYENGDPQAVLGDRLLSSWETEDQGLVWAAHHLETGELEASVPCQEATHYESARSPNGRYAVAGHLAFDFERGEAHCFGETAERKGIRLVSVGDDGTAYGFAGGDETTESAPVAVSLATGEPEVLPRDTEIPFLSLPKAGAFSPMADGGGLLFVFHPRG
ncbi:hypothetical protein ACG5V6_07825 [Streptomyces chitinivorans]|uniref:Lipoprotein n=1 Tax=Streptomyces chitinivorans TaxID=1257027 RepID=A0ABW7HQH7_9ACTN|nr:hypothetical protein [Streptomyces chitinivorans]MDH2407612.1 hypothetical protein [Streptomyces chitinivorans]